MKWSIWVIGEDGRGDPAGHWYKLTPTSGIRGFDSRAKAERHKIYMEGICENQGWSHKYSVEEFEDEHTKPEAPRTHPTTLDSKPKVWKKGMTS